MKKTIKIMAILMAMLMMVTMATACKSEGDDLDDILAGETNISADEDGESNDVDSNDSREDKEEGSDSNNDGQSDKESDDKESANDKEENKGSSDKGEEKGEDKKQESSSSKDSVIKPITYTIEENPLLKEGKKVNRGIAPSIDVDSTGFVKNNIKLKDLKGRNLVFFTGIDEPNFYYRTESGKLMNEWEWFDSLREEYGIRVKYIVSTADNAEATSLMRCLTYQTSGKQIDLVPTHMCYFPQYLNLSQGLDPYINIQNIGNSAGIDRNILEQSKWAGQYRCIAPIGAVDAIWYNETLTDQLGLRDPHKTFREGKWDWEAWKNYLISVPLQGVDGRNLSPWSQQEWAAISFWPQTNGITLFDIDDKAKTPKLINNFNDERCTEAWMFYSKTVMSTDYLSRRKTKDPWTEMFTDGTVIMNSTYRMGRNYSDSDYANSQRFNWVPYPKGKAATGESIVMSYGQTMMLPRIMKVKDNIPAALKVMELWANRYAESINDKFIDCKYFDFSYEERKEYFEFASKHTYLGVGLNTMYGLTGDERQYFKMLYWSFYNPNWNTATAIEQLRNLAGKACDEVVKFGI